MLQSLEGIGSRPDRVDAVVLSDLERHPVEAFLRGLFPQASFHHVPHHLCHAAAAFDSSGMRRAAVLCLDGYGDGSVVCSRLAMEPGSRS